MPIPNVPQGVFSDKVENSPRQAVMEMMRSYVKPQLLYVAAKLGIADLLRDRPRTFEQLANTVEAEPTALYRLLLGLVNIGLLYQENEGFGLTAQGRYLVCDRPDSLHDSIIWQGEEVFQAWGQLLYSVQTGKPAFAHVFGSEFFQYLGQNPQSQARFNTFMSNTSHQAAKALVAAYDFSAAHEVIDVGGAGGVLISTLLQSHPQLHGTLFDITADNGQTRRYLQKQGVAQRCQIVRGDFFEAIPTGGDVYILSQIIHDWDDERSLTILQNCRRAMPPTARLILFEHVMPHQVSTPNPAIDRDLVMLVLTGGRERNQDEFCQLLKRTGFELARIIPTQHCRSLLEAVPV